MHQRTSCTDSIEKFDCSSYFCVQPRLSTSRQKQISEERKKKKIKINSSNMIETSKGWLGKLTFTITGSNPDNAKVSSDFSSLFTFNRHCMLNIYTISSTFLSYVRCHLKKQSFNNRNFFFNLTCIIVTMILFKKHIHVYAIKCIFIYM